MAREDNRADNATRDAQLENAAEIQNQNNSGRTGTLKVAIYATNYPYSGGYLNGYLLFEYQFCQSGCECSVPVFGYNIIDWESEFSIKNNL